MPFVPKPSCTCCKATTSNIWRKDATGQVYCTVCAKKELDGCDDTNSVEGSQGSGSGSKSDWPAPSIQPTAVTKYLTASHLLGPLRKSARIKPSKYKYQPILKGQLAKGRSRRSIFKKNPIKAPSSVSTVVTSEYVFYEGQYWQVGDIVSVMDDDGGLYYAQIRGFLQDQYCEKSVIITWLLPTLSSPQGRFDPATYIVGPEEDLPRSLSCFELEMHAPSSYFRDKSSPYPTKFEGPELGYIWTRLGPEIRRVPPPEEVFGLRELDSDNSSTADKVRSKQDERRKKREGNQRKKGRGLKGVGAKAKEIAKDKLAAKEKAGINKAAIMNTVKDKIAEKDMNDKSVSKEKPAITPTRRETRVGSRSEKETKVAPVKEKPVTVAEGRARRERGRPRKMSID